MRYVIAVCAVVWLGTTPALAQETITVAWDPNSESDIVGYTLLAGTAPGVYTSTQWVGNVTSRTMTIPAGTYYLAVRAKNKAGKESAPSTEVSAVIAEQPKPIPNWQSVWHNTNTGQIVYWDSAKATFLDGGLLGGGQADAVWKVRTSGDFNGDGHKDLIFQHDDGYIAVWLLAGNALLESRMLYRLSDSNWHIVSAADFDGDSQADLLFQHRQSGDLVVWHMDGLKMREGVSLYPARVPDVNWRIVGTGDLNRDSRPDLVWQHLKTGVITAWIMKGTTMVEAGLFSLSGSSDPMWRIKGTADVNDDGFIDLLWQHEKSNHLAVWYLNGMRLVEPALLTPSQVSPGWVMIGSR